jgi:hypothetical protein
MLRISTISPITSGTNNRVKMTLLAKPNPFANIAPIPKTTLLRTHRALRLLP